MTLLQTASHAMTLEGRPFDAHGQSARGRAEHGVAALEPVLARCAIALTRSQHDADDLVQETLARLLAQPGDPALDAAEGYAVTTLTRLWLTRQRRLSAQARRLRAIAAERVQGASGQTGQTGQAGQAGQAKSLAQIERIVAALPPRQRAVLVLRAVMGLTTAQIARTLEIDEQAVRSSLHLARQRVRQQAGDQP